MGVAAFSVVRLRTRITKRYGEARTSTAASCSFAFIDVTWTCAPPPIGVVKRSQPDARNVELSSQRLPVRSRQPLEDDHMLAIIRLGQQLADGRQIVDRSDQTRLEPGVGGNFQTVRSFAARGSRSGRSYRAFGAGGARVGATRCHLGLRWQQGRTRTTDQSGLAPSGSRDLRC